jgi:hypothetical protein
LRTLTLGVLIVSGGTLAALPFRHGPSPSDASTTPATVSGPIHTLLDSIPEAPSDSAVALADHRLDSLPSWQPTSAPRPPRQPDIPLTYEDLALPIDQPSVIEQRFTATARVRDKLRAGETPINESADVALVMPEMETLTLEQRDHLESLPPATLPPAEPRAGGRLASSSPAGPRFQPLPQPEPETRQHHWIRQP